MRKQARRTRAAITLVTAAAVGAGGACGSDSGSKADETTTTTEDSTTTSTTTALVEETTTTAALTATTAARTTRTTRAATPRATTTTTTSLPRYPGCGPYTAGEVSSTTSTPTTTAASSTTTPASTSSTTYPTPVCGRPYRRRKSLILPDISEGDPLGDVPDAIAALPMEERLAEGDRWRSDARSELASVPAFSELALHLAAVGAPVELIRQTHEAALDEIRHAQECLRLASLFLGRTLVFGSFPTIAGRRVAGRKWWSRKRHLAHLAAQSLIDGCVSEGNSADDLWRRAERALPDVAVIARRLAADEDRHTELAWQIVDWCRAEGGVYVERALARAMRTLSSADLGTATARLRVDRRLPTLVPTAV